MPTRIFLTHHFLGSGELQEHVSCSFETRCCYEVRQRAKWDGLFELDEKRRTTMCTFNLAGMHGELVEKT